MRRFICIAAAAALAGCQTPSGVVDTASLVSKMTTQLNSKISDYVAASNTARQNDVRRLSLTQEATARQTAANADQFKVLDLAGDQRTHALLTGLQGPIAEPGDANAASAATARARLTKEFGQNTFDTAPLTGVATAVGALGKPRDSKDELATFGAFSKQVYDDLKVTTTETQNKAAPAPTQAGAPPKPKP